MRERIRSIFLCLLLVVSIFTAIEITTDFIEEVRGATLYVNETGSGGAYTSIQDAINDSIPGGTVFVYSGTYYEKVNVNKTINLTGEDRDTTIINCSGTASAIYVNVDWANVTGFTSTGGGSGFFDAGIELFGAHYCNIYNNTVISNDYYGMYIKSSTNNTISDNIVSSNLGNGIMLSYSDGNKIIRNNISLGMAHGVVFQYSDECDVVGNTAFLNDGGGFYISYSHNDSFRYNNLSNNYWHGAHFDRDTNMVISNNIASYNDLDGIHIFEITESNITDNILFFNDGDGIYLDDSLSNNLIANTAFNNTDNGIGVYGSSDNNLTFNIAYNNTGDGIFVWGSCENNLFVGNTVANNAAGISFGFNSDDNKIYHNNFLNNEGGKEGSCINQWDNGYPTGGNYWSSYGGVDAYNGPDQDIPGSDGIGDIQYKLDADSIDHYPLMEPVEFLNPRIYLLFPLNNSIFKPGTILDFFIYDSNLDTVNYSINGGSNISLTDPFDISTAGWIDNNYIVQVYAVDQFGNLTSAWFNFTIDTTKPIIQLNSPLNNSIIPNGAMFNFSIMDSYLHQVSYSINGGSDITIDDPYNIPTRGWVEGNYTIQINAIDEAGNSNSSWYFFIMQGFLPDLNSPIVTPEKGIINDEFNYSVIYTNPYDTPDYVNLSIDGINYTLIDYLSLPAPNGTDFHVNTYISNEQEDPAIAVYPNGSFVVVWSSWQGADLWGIYGQRYYSNGTKQGSEFPIEDDAGWERHPDISINPVNNDFVVVWDLRDFGDPDIKMKIFNSDGTPKTSTIAVNTYTPDEQEHPAVACSNNGNIIVSWSSWEQDGSYYGIYAQRFDSNGNPLGSEFQVNTITDSWQAFSDVVCLSDDRFIIVWMCYSTDAIYGQKYFSNGNTWGSDFRVSSTNGWYEQNPSITRDASNNFIVVWKSSSRSSGEEGIYFQRYFASGNTMGSETMLAAAPDSEWAETYIVCTSDDDYYVTWDAKNQESNDWDVYIQKLGSDGNKIGETLRILENNTNDQNHIKVGIDSNDKFVVVWQSFGMADDHETGVYGKKFFNSTSRKYYYTTTLTHGVHTYQFYAINDSVLVKTPLFIGPYVDYPPSLMNSDLTPLAGNTSTMFNYTITYTDLDDDPPSFMKIEIDGFEYTMLEVDPADVDYTDGKEFYYTTTLSSGRHDYQFFASDGTSEINTTLFIGPVIDDVPPITSLDISEPKDGTDPVYVNIDTLFTLTHNNDGCGSGVAFTWYSIDGEYFEGTSFDLSGYLNGPYIITWGSVDNVSNNETGNSINITLDTEPPPTTLDIGELKYRESGFDLWNVTPVTEFTLNSSDSSSGVDFTWYTIDGNYYEGSIFNLGGYTEGLHVITYGTSDNVGNNITEDTTTVYLDSQFPITELNVGTPRYYENPGDLWNVTDTTEFTLAASDQFSGVNFTWYTIDVDYFEGTSFNLSGRSEGLHNISWGSIDYLGFNESANLITVNIDISPPSANLSIGMQKFRAQATDLWNVTTSTKLSISVNDSTQGSGVNFTWYTIDGIFYVYSSPFSLSSGTHTITWGAIDNLGNNETQEVMQVRADVEAPVTDLQVGSPKYRQKVGDDWNITDTTTFILDSQDQLSGVALNWYMIDGIYFEGTSFTFIGFSDGLHTISWGAVDNLENNETGNLIQVYLDTAAPLTSLNIGNPKYRHLYTHNWNVTYNTEFSLSFEDLHSGVNKSWYNIDAQYFEGTDFDLSGLNEGSHIITWGSIDNLGNIETGNSIIISLDNTPPISGIEINTPKYRANEMDYWNVTDTTEFQLSSSDQYSGVNVTRYSIDDEYFEGTHFYLSGYTDGLHTITWENVDNLGNAETINILVVNLDTTPPSISVEIAPPNFTYEGEIYLSTSSPITIESSDWGIGSTTVYYSLDGGMTYSIYQSPFTVPSTTTSIMYYGEDVLGNTGEVMVVYVTVDFVDSDGDEIPDFEDTDDDGDGYPDSDDHFPFDSNEWVDTDSDGIGNNADLDDDNDGVYDEKDLDPLDPTIGKEAEDSQPEDSNWIFYILLVIIIVLIIVIAVILGKRRGGMPEEKSVVEEPKPKVEEKPLKKITEEKPKVTQKPKSKPKQPSQQKTEERLPPPPPKTEELPPPPPPPPPPD